MRLQGTTTIQAPRAKVWGFLTDAHSVSQCAPGLASLEILVPDQRFRAKAAVGFGSIKAAFVCDVDWVELVAPERARMKLHGTAPGSAVDAAAEMALAGPDGGPTQLDWAADVTIVGTLASLAMRLLGGVAERLTRGFFDCVRQKIELPPSAPAASPAD